jgi:hypothetical protein
VDEWDFGCLGGVTKRKRAWKACKVEEKKEKKKTIGEDSSSMGTGHKRRKRAKPTGARRNL